MKLVFEDIVSEIAGRRVTIAELNEAIEKGEL